MRCTYFYFKFSLLPSILVVIVVLLEWRISVFFIFLFLLFYFYFFFLSDSTGLLENIHGFILNYALREINHFLINPCHQSRKFQLNLLNWFAGKLFCQTYLKRTTIFFQCIHKKDKLWCIYEIVKLYSQETMRIMTQASNVLYNQTPLTQTPNIYISYVVCIYLLFSTNFTTNRLDRNKKTLLSVPNTVSLKHWVFFFLL